MFSTKGLICRYLKGSIDGAKCEVINRLIRTTEDADIHLCMSRRHEACVYYVLSLRELVRDSASADNATGTL